MTLLPEVEQAILDAVDRHHRRRRTSRWSRLLNVRMRVPVIALAVLLGTTSALAASGVILTGSPVRTHGHQQPTVGFGVPAPGGSRLLPLRAPDPDGGPPWGMRVISTTRGYVCVQLGRVDHGRLGELGIDGAFHDDGRFHALPVNALPEAVSLTQSFAIDCETGERQTFAGDIVGLEASAASNPRPHAGSRAGRREISFGLLGPHAVAITYRSGAGTRSRKVLAGLGAYLIVQRASGARPFGSISDTIGNAEGPASPNGALTEITYRYAEKTCTDNGHNRILRECGLSEGPPPKPAPLPTVHVPLRVHLRIRRHTIVSAEIVFRAPYPVTSVRQGYSVGAYGCHGVYTGASVRRDVAKGALLHISVGSVLSYACARSMSFTVEYVRSLNGLPTSTPLGAVTIRIPSGAHARPLPRSVQRRLRSLARRRASGEAGG